MAYLTRRTRESADMAAASPKVHICLPPAMGQMVGPCHAKTYIHSIQIKQTLFFQSLTQSLFSVYPLTPLLTMINRTTKEALDCLLIDYRRETLIVTQIKLFWHIMSNRIKY